MSRIAPTLSTMISLGFFKFSVAVQDRKTLIPQFFHILFALCLSTPLFFFSNIHLNLLTIVYNTFKLLITECERPSFLLKKRRMVVIF